MFLCVLSQVSNILSQFPIWKDYKDQKHDLFLVDRPTVGYLQGVLNNLVMCLVAPSYVNIVKSIHA